MPIENLTTVYASKMTRFCLKPFRNLNTVCNVLIQQHVILTIGQSHDARDDDQNQSKHFDEGQRDLRTSCQRHTPAVHCHHERYRSSSLQHNS